MGFALKLDVPISETVCNSCNITDKTQQISSGNLNIIYQIPISGENNNVLNSDFVVSIDVRKIKYKKIGEGAYTTTAQLFVICPKCDKEHIVEKCFEAPRIYLEQSRDCDICGEKLCFQEEEFNIEDIDGIPFVTIKGILICKKCQNETPFTTSGNVLDENTVKDNNTYIITCGKGQKLYIEMN